VRLLLDTSVLIPLAADEALPAELQAALTRGGTDSFASVASLWEIAIKFRLGKLRLGVALEDMPLLLA